MQNKHTLMPIVIYTVFSAVAYIILIRFYSYITSLKVIYDDLRNKEKLAAVGQIAAAVGHEIRNPLASLRGFTQLQREKYPNTNDYYSIMIQEIDRINNIVSDLMYLGKPTVAQFNKADVKEIFSYTLSILQHQAEAQNIIFRKEIDQSLPLIDCDENQLKQVLINILKNAVEAMQEGGIVDIKVNHEEKGKIMILVKDDGPGIPKEHLNKVGRTILYH